MSEDIEKLMKAAAQRAVSETAEERQARHMRIYRRLCKDEGAPPLRVVEADE